VESDLRFLVPSRPGLLWALTGSSVEPFTELVLRKDDVISGIGVGRIFDERVFGMLDGGGIADSDGLVDALRRCNFPRDVVVAMPFSVSGSSCSGSGVGFTVGFLQFLVESWGSMLLRREAPLSWMFGSAIVSVHPMYVLDPVCNVAA